MAQLDGWNIRDSIRLSLDQICHSSYVQERDAPPGVFNYGLHSPVELTHPSEGVAEYSHWVRRRIEAFEPRLDVHELDIVNDRIEIRATIKETQEPIVWSL